VQNDDTTTFSTGVSYNWPGHGSPSAVLLSVTAEEQQLPNAEPQHRYALFFGYRQGFRQTDDLILPRRGYFGHLTVGAAPGGVSTTPFGRFTGAATLLVPLGRNDDLMLRTEGGIVAARTREGIPSTFLFRTGGDQTVRGYAFESLGVKRDTAVVGGRYLLIGSAEVTHWFSPTWGVAAFVDAGNAWDSAERYDPALGSGLGARFRTPIGPVRVDVAYGEEVKAVRLHFSVGFVF
jgi:translocation and assembly module TamA